jgi:hypothetical protein
MMGKELKGLDKILFSLTPSMMAKDKKAAQEKMIDIVDEYGEEIVLLCYLDDSGNNLQEVNEAYRMKLIGDMGTIVPWIFGSDGDEPAGKPQRVQKIKRP